MCVPISPYSHITPCLKFDVPANPWACTTSPCSPCLQAPSCSLCPSPAAGSHALSQPCCHLCLLCPQVCFQITQVSPISLSLTFFSLFCSMPPVNTSQAGWRAEGRGHRGFHTPSQVGSTSSDLLLVWVGCRPGLTGAKHFPPEFCVIRKQRVVEASKQSLNSRQV